MSFEKEMDLFFMRNCYFEKQQEKVRNTPAYQRAVELADATLAQEIATRILETDSRPLAT